MPGNLRDQTDQEVEIDFWSMSHEWGKLENEALVRRIRTRFSEVFLQETGLGADRRPVVERHLHVGEGVDASRRYICATFSLTGSTYFFYEEPEPSLEEWVEEMASLQAANYQVERDEYGFTELEDWGGWKSMSVHKSGSTSWLGGFTRLATPEPQVRYTDRVVSSLAVVSGGNQV